MRLLPAAFLGLAMLAAPAVAGAEESLADRYSPPMAMTGTVMAVTGAFGLMISAPLTASAGSCDDDCTRRDLWPVVLASGLTITASIPLLVIGMQPAREEPSRAAGVASVLFRASAGRLGLDGAFF
ncbi:MAG: hypothetical protein HOV80_02400 [Polyangiaceae bacterium]|nr:hypothetical protein [Polyangiaceae bacterium]